MQPEARKLCNFCSAPADPLQNYSIFRVNAIFFSQTCTLQAKLLGRTQPCTCQEKPNISSTHCESSLLSGICPSLPDSNPSKLRSIEIQERPFSTEFETQLSQSLKKHHSHTFRVQTLILCTALQKAHALSYFLLHFFSAF